MKRILISALVLCLAALWGSSQVRAQGVLLVHDDDHHPRLPRPHIRPAPQPDLTYSIKDLEINATIRDQVAETQISQVFRNPGSRVLNASFVFPLPPDAAVQQLTLLVDGKEYEGKLLPKDEARKVYEDYVRKSQDPALLEWMGSGMFKTSVFPIPPGAVRTVTIKYSQVLRKFDEMTDYLIPLATAKYTSQPIEKLSFRISVESSGKLKTLYSPAYPINISRNGDHQAIVTVEQSQTLPSADFRLLFDTSDQLIGASLLSHWPADDDEGYFMLLSSPEFKASSSDTLPKDVVLVIDRSGSMSGKKIEQVKESLRFVVNQLNPGDRFNIVAYDNDVEVFRPELQRFDDQTRQQALGFVESIYAGGSTNISEALATAFGMLNESDSPQYVIFLTDGLPTAGLTGEPQIVAAAKQANRSQARLLSLGVGYDVNSRLLDRLTNANRGLGEYVRPEEDIEAYVGRLYQRISSPVLTDIQVEFLTTDRDESAGAIVNRIYPSTLPDVFLGEQLVIAGRYKASGDVKVRVTGKVRSETQRFDFPLNLASKGTSNSHQFVERIWASRRIGEIIDELDLKGPNSELVEELVQLSTRHGILTPYTSFLADDQATQGLAFRDSLESAESRLRLLSETDGVSGFAQRTSKADFKRAGEAAPAGLSRGGSGGRPGSQPSSSDQAAYAFGGAVYRDVDEDKTVVSEQVRNVGKTSLYRRGKVWIAANVGEVNPAELPEDTRRIKRFSSEYFDLVAQNTQEENTVLARLGEDEQLLIKLREELILIE